QDPSIMGFEDEAEQSFRRPCRQTSGRSKQTCELTSSVVPRGTSFHHSAELEFPPIEFDPAGSCGCGFSGPPELGAVYPDAVHDHGQPACQRHDNLQLSTSCRPITPSFGAIARLISAAVGSITPQLLRSCRFAGDRS